VLRQDYRRGRKLRGSRPERHKRLDCFTIALKLDQDKGKTKGTFYFSVPFSSLGLRFGGSAPDAMIEACRLFDVFSMNSYTTAPSPQQVERAFRLSGRPVLIGEFHFGTPGRGLSAGLRQTANQQERGVAYRYYVENAAAIPCLIGVHWFQWIDQPSTGRFDGENYNIGMVDIADRPYSDFIQAMQTTHNRLLDIHAGRRTATDRQARIQ
jgi:hypothetical protein